VSVARAQAGVEQVAGFRHAGDQRVIHALVVMSVPGRACLMAVHLDGQAIDIERHLTLPMTPAHRTQASAGQFAHRLT
jgi:hypothetical protein